jgi:hypothetical protein
VYYVEVAVITTQVDLQSGVITDHIQVGGFFATCDCVEVVYGLTFGDDTALGKDWVFVGYSAEWNIWVVLLNVVGFGKERVELGATASKLAMDQAVLSVVNEPLYVSVSSVQIYRMVFAFLQ